MNTPSMQPLFIALEPFGPESGDKWKDYLQWSGLPQLERLLSLDSTLCSVVLNEIKVDDWPHIVNEDDLLCYFTNLDFMMAQLPQNTDANIFCVFWAVFVAQAFDN